MRTLMTASVLLCLSPAVWAGVWETDIKGKFGGEGRFFPHESDAEAKYHTNLSTYLEGTAYAVNGNHSLVLTPFGRLDQHDQERTHWDIREAYYEYWAGSVVITAGLGQVFWGVIETKHLVDVINQD